MALFRFKGPVPVVTSVGPVGLPRSLRPAPVVTRTPKMACCIIGSPGKKNWPPSPFCRLVALLLTSWTHSHCLDFQRQIRWVAGRARHGSR